MAVISARHRRNAGEVINGGVDDTEAITLEVIQQCLSEWIYVFLVLRGGRGLISAGVVDLIGIGIEGGIIGFLWPHRGQVIQIN